MTDIAAWNRRAAYLVLCLESGDPLATTASDARPPSPLDRARQVLSRWQRLKASLPARELSAATHQGLIDGVSARAVQSLRASGRGTIMLSGPMGTSKTVGAAWFAYHYKGTVLWLEATKIGSAHPDKVLEWRAEASSAGFVVIDDIGAGSSSGEWASKKIVDVVTTVLDRDGPAIITSNLNRDAFALGFDGGQHGRLLSRFSMPPHKWQDVPGIDRRAGAKSPPDLEKELPPRELKARKLVNAREAIGLSQRAAVEKDLDMEAMLFACETFGFSDWAELDSEIQAYEDRITETKRLMMRAAQRMRSPYREKNEQAESEVVVKQLARCGLLDHLDYVANELGRDHGDILAEIGKTRLTLGPEDKPKLMALMSGDAP